MWALFVSWESRHVRVVMKSHRGSHQCHALASGSAIHRARGLASFQSVFSCFCTCVSFIAQYTTGEKDTGNKEQATETNHTEQWLVLLSSILHISPANVAQNCSLILPTGPSFGPVEGKRKEQGMFLNKLPRYFFCYFSYSFFIG